jgi:ABC-2 type transport system ATP-binding protein
METAIRTGDLSKTFGQTRALVSLNLEVQRGEVIGYLGPNGAGKTTTIRLLLGLIRATSGRAEIFGVDCQADPVRAHGRVAYVPGEATLWPSLTGAETLHLLGRVQGRSTWPTGTCWLSVSTLIRPRRCDRTPRAIARS